MMESKMITLIIDKKGHHIQDILAALQDWDNIDEPHLMSASNFFDMQVGVSTNNSIQPTFLLGFEE